MGAGASAKEACKAAAKALKKKGASPGEIVHEATKVVKCMKGGAEQQKQCAKAAAAIAKPEACAKAKAKAAPKKKAAATKKEKAKVKKAAAAKAKAKKKAAKKELKKAVKKATKEKDE